MRHAPSAIDGRSFTYDQPCGRCLRHVLFGHVPFGALTHEGPARNHGVAKRPAVAGQRARRDGVWSASDWL